MLICFHCAVRWSTTILVVDSCAPDCYGLPHSTLMKVGMVIFAAPSGWPLRSWVQEGENFSGYKL